MTRRALLVGLGNIGMGYDLELPADDFALTHMRAISRHPDFELVAAVDPNPGRRDVAAAAYRAPVYRSVADLPDELQVDVAILATPTESHLATVEKLFGSLRPSIVLLEKPIATGVDQGLEVLQLCEANKSALFVNYMRRSDEAIAQIQSKIANDEYKGPFSGVAWYTRGLFNNGSHLLNLLQYWLGEVQDFSILDVGVPGAIDNDPEPAVRFNFELGAVNFLPCPVGDYAHVSLRLLGKNGSLDSKHGASSYSWHSVENDQIFPGYRVLAADGIEHPGSSNEPQLRVLEQISEHMNGRAALLCSGADALGTVRVLDEVRRRL